MNATIANDTSMSDDDEDKLWEFAKTKRTEGLTALILLKTVLAVWHHMFFWTRHASHATQSIPLPME